MPRPDEGLIHAWLDGQLPPEEAARIEELAANDPAWAAAVAEARGLVAASSRILAALDHVPAGVVPKGTSTRTAQRLPWWTKIAAAVVVVVGGSVVVMQNAPEGRVSELSTERRSAEPTPDTQKAVVEAPVTAPPIPAPATPGARARMPVAPPIAGVMADAGMEKDDSPALRREAVAPPPVALAAAPTAAPTPSAKPIVAEERKAMQDAVGMAAEVSAAKSLVAKAAPSAAPTAPPQPPQPQQPQQPQQTSTQDLARAQNAVTAKRVTGGVIAARSAQEQQRQQARMCYRLVPDNLRGGSAIIMRAVRTAGDTLFLAPVAPNAPQRAWLVLRDGMRGVMTTGGDLRSATRITGTPATCPAPAP